MGRYVEFWEGSPAGLPGLVLEHYAQFRAWYLGELLSEFSEDCEPDLLELLRAHPRLTAALPISTPEQARLVDLLVSELVGSFLDRMEGPRLTLIHGPQFHARRYEEIRRWVGQVLGDNGSQAWGHVLDGRGIWRTDHTYPFTSGDLSFKVGFLHARECLALVDVLNRAPTNPAQPEIFEYFRAAVLHCATTRQGLVAIVA